MTAEEFLQKTLIEGIIIPDNYFRGDEFNQITQVMQEFAKIKCDELKSELEPQLLFLSCLQNAGVDNWEGYEEAQNLYDEYLNEQ